MNLTLFYRLLRIIDEQRITVVQCTPSTLLTKFSKGQVEKVLLGKNSSLRVLVIGGEPFPSILQRIKHSENRTRIFNVYGITEVSCWASITEIDSETEETDLQHLGKPLSETLLQVRSESGEVVNEGEGILFIGKKISESLIFN